MPGMRWMRLPYVAALPLAAFVLVFAVSYAVLRGEDAAPKAAAARAPAKAPTGKGPRIVVSLGVQTPSAPTDVYLASVGLDGSDPVALTKQPDEASTKVADE